MGGSDSPRSMALSGSKPAGASLSPPPGPGAPDGGRSLTGSRGMSCGTRRSGVPSPPAGPVSPETERPSVTSARLSPAASCFDAGSAAASEPRWNIPTAMSAAPTTSGRSGTPGTSPATRAPPTATMMAAAFGQTTGMRRRRVRDRCARSRASPSSFTSGRVSDGYPRSVAVLQPPQPGLLETRFRPNVCPLCLRQEETTNERTSSRGRGGHIRPEAGVAGASTT